MKRFTTFMLALMFVFAGVSPATASHEFDDVPTDDVFHGDIAAIAAVGITKGCNPPANNRFCPGQAVTRGQMAAFMVRALNLKQTSNAGRFSDVPSGSTFATDINRLATAGITKGCNPPANNRFCPDQAVTRGQMAAFMSRALGLSAPASFGPGTWRVGADISPGTYRSGTADNCYWERVRGFGGSVSDIIANDFIDYRTVVTISASDAGFRSERCGTWTRTIVQITSSRTAPFGDGVWVVGTDIAPGVWRNSTSSGTCYWERLGGFSGESGDIKANNISTSIQTVEISSSDQGFRSSRCGTWSRIG